MNKKAVSPVVATALLIVVSVIAVIGFQSWFGTYSSSMFVKTEQESSSTSQIGIETLVGNQLYFKNTLSENITITQIKIGNRECNITQNISTGVHPISLGTCLDELTLDSSIGDIVVITDKQIFAKKHLFKDVVISSSQSQGLQTIVDDFSEGILNEVKFNGSELILNNFSGSYFLIGNYTSKIYNAGGLANWSNLDWNYELQEIENGETEISLNTGLFSYNDIPWSIGTPAQLIDNNVGTRGFHCDSSDPGAWVKVDFGLDNEKNLNKWAYYAGSGLVAIWNIEYSDDNLIWNTAYTGLDTTINGWREAIINSGTHRYWRTIKTNSAVTGPSTAFVYELKLYESVYDNTFLSIQTRTSNNNIDWTNWQTQTLPLEIINESTRYFQYRILFETENQDITPILKFVSFNYKLN